MPIGGSPWLEDSASNTVLLTTIWHTPASTLAAQVAALLEIADVLGHKTLAMVKRCSHFVVDHKGKVIEKMTAAKGL